VGLRRNYMVDRGEKSMGGGGEESTVGENLVVRSVLSVIHRTNMFK